MVGRTPRSARDALVPLFANGTNRLQGARGRRGRRPRTGGSAPRIVQVVRYGEKQVTLGKDACPTLRIYREIWVIGDEYLYMIEKSGANFPDVCEMKKSSVRDGRFNAEAQGTRR